MVDKQYDDSGGVGAWSESPSVLDFSKLALKTNNAARLADRTTSQARKNRQLYLGD